MCCVDGRYRGADEIPDYTFHMIYTILASNERSIQCILGIFRGRERGRGRGDGVEEEEEEKGE